MTDYDLYAIILLDIIYHWGYFFSSRHECHPRPDANGFPLLVREKGKPPMNLHRESALRYYNSVLIDQTYESQFITPQSVAESYQRDVKRDDHMIV